MCRLFYLTPLLLAGCGGGMALTGEVTLKGRPVTEGRIVFTPVEAGAPALWATIRDGRYAVPAAQGAPAGATYAVEIVASVPTGRRVPNAMRPGEPPVEETVNPVPPEFNDRTTLRVTVSAKAAENVFDFHLHKP